MNKRSGGGKGKRPRTASHPKQQPASTTGRNRGSRPPRSLNVFLPSKQGKQVPASPGDGIAGKPTKQRRPSLAPAPRFDVFVPEKKPRPPTYMDERAALLGSNNLDHPWACEPADDRTMGMLAKLAGTTVRDLQYRRYPYDAQCPERVPVTRARCWRCPFWDRHPELTPWDGAPIVLDPVDA